MNKRRLLRFFVLKRSLGWIVFIFAIIPLFFGFSNQVLAETICDVDYNQCKITITIKIAFSGATNQQIQTWKNEIEDVWNGPNGSQTTGDCDCQVQFKVNTMAIGNTANVNCNPPPQGWHCVMVTPWNNNNNNLPWFYKPDGTKEHVVAYMGYNSQSPSQGGNSINGWWSDQTSRPVQDPQGNPTGENYKDAAHEAGHMMGLDDDGGAANIMGQTLGPNARPTQDQIDKVVENVCGQGACPDHCCCGNGEIDKDKGEQCDPMAESEDCKEEEYCCSICCQCHLKLCSPEDGEFTTQSDCERKCEGGNCLYNYETGCWNCIKYISRWQIPSFGITDLMAVVGGLFFFFFSFLGFVTKKKKIVIAGLGFLFLGIFVYFSPSLAKQFKETQKFEESSVLRPVPQPSLEFAALKETVLILESQKETQLPEEEISEETQIEETPEEETPQEELPVKEQLQEEELIQDKDEEPSSKQEKESSCQIACEESGFSGGECILFSPESGFCEEQELITPVFADEFCEESQEFEMYNICCCSP